MSHSFQGSIDLESEVSSPSMRVKLVSCDFIEPPNNVVLCPENYFRIYLCFSVRHRKTRACFANVWNQQRYEHVGDMFILPPSMELRLQSEKATALKVAVCQLNPEPLLKLFDKWPEPTDKLLLDSLDVQDPKIRNLVLRLAEEAKQPGFASEMLIEAISSQMVIELFRRGKDILETYLPGGLAPWQLRRIHERLNEIYKAPTLSELAELCNISVRQLSRGFYAIRGYSIGVYVARSQIEHAKHLLATGATVANIASILGFSSPSSFCVAFRREVGLTTGQYRQQLLHSSNLKLGAEQVSAPY